MIVQSGPGINYSFENTGDIIGQISGYVDHRGKMVKDIDIGEIRGIKNNFLDEGIESCGIVTKFSTRNPSHEMRIRDEVMDDFKKINKELNMSVLINIHHVDLALKYADRVIGIKAGEIVYDGPSAKVDSEVLKQIYGRELAADEVMGA